MPAMRTLRAPLFTACTVAWLAVLNAAGPNDWPGFGNDPGDSRIVPFESRRIGRRSWRVSAGNFGDPGTLTAFAYCKA